MVEKISRSEQKRLHRQVKVLVQELVELSDNDVKALPLKAAIVHEIIECRRLKGGARKRQIQYLAKMLRQFPLNDVLDFLKAKKGSVLKQNYIFHEAERWRDVIINEAMELHDNCRRNQTDFEPAYQSRLIGELMEELTSLNEGDLRRCTYQYVRARNKSHYRELFRMIKAAVEMKERRKL